jgi:hypothetical protein
MEYLKLLTNNAGIHWHNLFCYYCEQVDDLDFLRKADINPTKVIFLRCIANIKCIFISLSDQFFMHMHVIDLKMSKKQLPDT